MIAVARDVGMIETGHEFAVLGYKSNTCRRPIVAWPDVSFLLTFLDIVTTQHCMTAFKPP